MNINEAMDFIHQTQWKGSKLGLSNIEVLMDLLGNPQDELKYIHIAGTNGKGSTASMLSSILTKAGYKTGLYTSPFINKFNERIQVNGENVPDEFLIQSVERLKEALDKMDNKPTEFEIVTALGFMYFYEVKCDIVVLEVGLGGRLDSTNIIHSPEVAVITAIGLDHTKELGENIEEIAWEKAGIIKEDCDIVIYDQDKIIVDVIKKVSDEKSSRLHIADFNKIEPLEISLKNQSFNYKEYKNIKLALLGDHQLNNAATVIETVEVLRDKGWDISKEDLYEGLENVKWPGRFEVLNENPIFIVDGAHNPQGVITLANNIEKYFKGKKITFITGVMADKEFDKMYDMIAPYAEKFVVVEPNNPRAFKYHDLGVLLHERYNVDVVEGESVSNGIKKALDEASPDDVIIAFGSLYMSGDIRSYFIK
ncbi:MAG: bifunctional folylpolyglutamate synthase/dihydrofolate synthase [Tissierellia bacterium]|nr:bifunctional folylpolyglutamate synthase/dihydrofolate synthase [Tissierellia bacterium]